MNSSPTSRPPAAHNALLSRAPVNGQLKPDHGNSTAFTLIELLVVISIIIILLGLLFPAFRGVQNQAKKTQAKNDLTQIVTAVNAFYTEYGRYPVTTQGSDATFATDNSDLINTLRAIANGANASNALNTRQIVFMTPPDVKDPNNPRGGVTSAGIYYDPWGKNASCPEAGVYHIRIDGNYDSIIANAYTDGSAGGDPNNSYQLRQGVIAWSLGSDGALGTKIGSSTSCTGNNSFRNSDDMISWQ